jgi:hypothetical protein
MLGTRLRAALSATCFAVVLFGCGGTLSPARRVQEASYELSNAMRFGRMDIAMERVNRAGRDEFVKHHALWGGGIRILDCEVVRISTRDKENADVVMAVSWQRASESEVRATQIAQKWKDYSGEWKLESEERTAGDVGLLGEQVAVIRPPSGQDVQFRTITIR